MKDVIGMTCSGLCIAHCAILPMAIGLGVPVSTVLLTEAEWPHRVLAGVIILVGLWSLPSGWRRHGNANPLWLGLAGITLLLISIFAPESLEIGLAFISGLALIAAHFINRVFLARELNHG